ncbi:MAG: hypothetical protein QF453_04730 [Candidatus Marinimicrobia bacterium]|nr:hypothetical protein [Candidatus Neomarinimicrobiota bacterium]
MSIKVIDPEPLVLTQYPSGIIISGTFYEFEQGYSLVGNMVPGRGYWMGTNFSGEIIISRKIELFVMI